MLLRRSLTLTTLLALGVAAAVARGDTVELRSGRTIVGTVRFAGSDEVVVDSAFPEARTLTLKRDDIAPQSMHAILVRLAGPTDAAKRREAGEFAEAHGLLVPAIVDFARVKRLDPTTAADMDARIVRLYESAWALARTRPVAPPASHLSDVRVLKLRSSAKMRLVDAYVSTGTVFL